MSIKSSIPYMYLMEPVFLYLYDALNRNAFLGSLNIALPIEAFEIYCRAKDIYKSSSPFVDISLYGSLCGIKGKLYFTLYKSIEIGFDGNLMKQVYIVLIETIRLCDKMITFEVQMNDIIFEVVINRNNNFVSFLSPDEISELYLVEKKLNIS